MRAQKEAGNKKEATEISKDTKIKIPLSLVVSACVATFVLGGIMNEVLNNDTQRVEAVNYLEKKLDEAVNHLDQKINEAVTFLVGEVSGLRSDWERRNKDVEKRLDKLEKNN